MNKFILQFSRVEKAYRLVEEAFIAITNSAASKTLQERMKRKCNMEMVKPILSYLGFGANCFSNEELQQIFDKSPESDEDISFQRLLIGFVTFASLFCCLIKRIIAWPLRVLL